MNNYSLTEEIGRGTNSVVYKGRKKKTIEYVAVKSVDKKSQDKVLNEVAVLHEMDHPNILKFFNWYQTPNHLWLIIEYCAGGDLAKVIAQDQKLPEYTIQMFGRDLLSGLQYLHSQGVINCDLKPSNILIDGCGVLKYCDFGLSRRLSEISPASGEGIRGTPVYMAPELFEEKAVHSFASDLWSLGCVLYELASGHAPFHTPSGSISEVISGILEKAHPPLPDASIEFRNLIDQSLKKDAGERIDWDQMLSHPFWNFRLPKLPLPQQPHFEASVMTRRQRLAAAAQQRGPIGASAADVMSKIASDNIAKERDTPSYSKARRSNDYAVLDNADTEVDFAPARPAPAAALPPREDTPGERNIEEFDDGQKLEFVDNPSGRRKTPAGAAGGTNGEAPASSVRRFQEAEGRRGSVPQSRTGSPPVAGEVPSTRSHVVSPPTTAEKPSSSGGPSKRAASSGARDSTRPPSSPAYGVYKLLFHSSDKNVRPITETKSVELTQLQFPPKTPFKPLPLLTVLSLSRSELETFLTSVYKAIAGKTPVAHKLVFLDYFETLCLDPKSANNLINSSLLKLFLNILKQCKSLNLKAKLAHAVGVLVCNATYIASSVRDTNVISTLTELLRLQDDAVRRAAMACLGEFLFYVSTQEGQEPGEEWTIPTSTVSLAVKCLAVNEDEQLQLYVAQTIDNVSSASSSYGKMFCSVQIATQLLETFNSTKNTMLRVTISSALSRIGRQSPAVIHQLVEKADPAVLLEPVQDGNPRVQQAFLNLINLSLLDSPAKIQDAICEDKLLLPVLKSLLEHQSSVIRAKAVLTIALVTRNHPMFFLLCCQNKFLMLLDRISKDKEGYVRHCVKAAHEGIQQLVMSITGRITAELTKISDRHRPTPAIVKNLKDHLKLFPIVLQVMVYGSSQMRALIFNQQFITDLSFFLLQIEDLTFIPPDDFKGPLLSILEAIPQNPSMLGAQSTHLISHLLKALMTLLHSETGDVRFLSLKILLDMLSELLSLSTVYSIHAEEVSPSTQQLNEMFVQQIFPACKKLLLDEDPIPSWALKLLNLLLDRNPSLVTHLQRLDLVPIFFRFFQPDNANNSLVNVSLIKKVVESPDIDKELVYRLDIVRKLGAVIQYAAAKSIDTFLEPVLDIAYQLLSNASTRPEFIAANEPLLDNINVFARLLTNPDPQISERASRCISIIPMMYGPNFHALVVSPSNLPHITHAVARGPPAVQKYVLSALKLITGQSPRLMNVVLRDEPLYAAIRQLSTAPRGSKIATLAGQILRATPSESLRNSP